MGKVLPKVRPCRWHNHDAIDTDDPLSPVERVAAEVVVVMLRDQAVGIRIEEYPAHHLVRRMAEADENRQPLLKVVMGPGRFR